MKKRRLKTKVEQRPAETGGITGSVALLIGRAAGIDDPDTLVALGALVGFLPAAITWLTVTVRGER